MTAASPPSGSGSKRAPLPAGEGRLRGEVSFSRQEPAVGAAVVLIREGDPGRLLLGVTDLHGCFRFESIPGGSWTIGIVQDGAVPEIKSGIVVKPPGRAVVDILLKKATGRVEPPVFDLARFEGTASASARSTTSAVTKTAATTGATKATITTATDTKATITTATDMTAITTTATATTATATTAPATTAPAISSAAPSASSSEELAHASDGAAGGSLIVEVLDSEMKPIREARLTFRSRGPLVDPLRGVTDGEGTAQFRSPEPGEYVFKVDVPGYLPARIDRLVLGRTAPFITAVMTPRPLDYPSRPAELLPEEKSVPPEGFPGNTVSGGAAQEAKPAQQP